MMQQKYKKNSDKSTMKYLRFPNELLAQMKKEDIDNFSQWVFQACRDRVEKLK